MFKRLILSSDPLLSSFHFSKKVHRKIDQSMLPLLDLTEEEKHELKIDEHNDNEDNDGREQYEDSDD